MTPFNRENQSGRNRDFGKTRFKSDRPDMHKATCANCGKICEVPFRPTGSKPVFCKDCFNNNESGNYRKSEQQAFGNQKSQDRQMYDAVCAKCGNNCQIPFRPTPGRKIFCSRCFENREDIPSHRPDRTFSKPNFKNDDNRLKTDNTPNYSTQFETLNAKMDAILHLLTKIPVK